MGTVFPYKGHWRFKFKDAAGEWRTVTSKARTKAEARSELHEKELEVERQNLGLAASAQAGGHRHELHARLPAEDVSVQRAAGG